jgi:hypothetical protein
LNRGRCGGCQEFARARPRRLSAGKRGRILGSDSRENPAQICHGVPILNIRNS